MSTPLEFTANSPRAHLPFLFAAQAQKEVTVNEALARIDALLAPAVEGEATTPPSAPAEGESWIVAANPQGLWAGHAGELAFHCAGTWMFAAPTEGMTVFDRSAGANLRWLGTWQSLALPAAPAGGGTVDAEARTAIASLIAALRDAGLGV
ncbi:MAG: DUF2793 domain-containing protein [Erythrobacter sp.]|nr:DUF2793 domain-containing protein [Erythrobacter sp.]NCQ64776.1 DUF2793 domain-containing protein [Alphaproteobacteria bacterium]